MLDAMPQIVCLLTPDGRVEYVNQYALDYTGLDREAALTVAWQSVIHPDDFQRAYAGWEEAVRSGVPLESESRLKRGRDGAYRWHLTRAVPTQDETGQIKRWVSVSTDIHDRKETESRLRLLEAAIQQSSEALLITDGQLEPPGPQILFVNPAFMQMTGYREEELLGQTPRMMQGPKTSRYMLANLRQEIAQGHIFTAETINYRKDGSEYYVEWTISPLRDSGGQITEYVSTQRDVTARKASELHLRHQFERLTSLRAIDAAILTNLGLEFTLNLALDQALQLLDMDAANIYLLDRETKRLVYVTGRGYRPECAPPVTLSLEESPVSLALAEHRLVVLDDLSSDADTFFRSDWRAGEGFQDYYAMPLEAKGEARGVLELCCRDSHERDADWQEFFYTLAGQVALAIDNALLFDDLQHANLELVTSYDAIIEGWSRALDLRDHETEGHSQRVTDLTLQLAQAFGMSEEELLQVRRGALLHDIGKMGIPDHILRKPGPLTEDEWIVMRLHPEYAYHLLYPIPFLRPCLDIPLCHHEKWDGTGYPYELEGEAIPLAARLFAIVDVWDALRSDRPYRAAWSAEKTLAHIQALSGTHFDPAVVEVFRQLMSRKNDSP